MTAQQTLREIIDNHELVHLATVDADGIPTVRGVDYAVGDTENVLYFVTRKSSRKIAHITNNPNVGFAIDRECSTPQELMQAKYLKGTGTAAIIENPDEAHKAFSYLIKKYPVIAELPGDPSEFVCVRLEMQNVLVSDHTVHFGYMQEVNFS